MSGTNSNAIQLITVNVYGVDAALITSSENAGLVVDGSTSGLSEANQPTTSIAVETADAVKAQPSRSALVSRYATTKVTTASTASTIDPTLPRMICCQPTASAISRMATGPTDNATDRARPRTSAVVFRAR